MRIRFLEIAEIELDEAIQYYNYEVAGLGDDFLTEVLDTLDRIARFPQAWHPCSKEHAGVKLAVFHMESFTRSEQRKFSLLLLQIYTESQTTGKIDCSTSPTIE